MTDVTREQAVGVVGFWPPWAAWLYSVAMAAGEPEVADEYAKGTEVVMQWDGGEHVEPLLPMV
jgi:hypothetical protein